MRLIQVVAYNGHIYYLNPDRLVSASLHAKPHEHWTLTFSNDAQIEVSNESFSAFKMKCEKPEVERWEMIQKLFDVFSRVAPPVSHMPEGFVTPPGIGGDKS